MFEPVLKAEELWEGELYSTIVSGHKLLLLRIQGEAHAFADRCAHLGFPLSKGNLKGCVLTCSAHHFQYDACTGKGLNPRNVNLKRYPVRVEDGFIAVDVEG